MVARSIGRAPQHVYFFTTHLPSKQSQIRSSCWLGRVFPHMSGATLMRRRPNEPLFRRGCSAWPGTQLATPGAAL